MEVYKAIYVGEEFPEYTGTECDVWDNNDNPDFPCYNAIIGGQEFDNMDDSDFEFI